MFLIADIYVKMFYVPLQHNIGNIVTINPSTNISTLKHHIYIVA